MDIITFNGLNTELFDQKLLNIIGNTPGNEGFKLLVQAKALRRNKVEVCDWLFCLAKTSGTSVWNTIIEKHNTNPDDFIDIVHNALNFEKNSKPSIANKLTKESISVEVIKMLEFASEGARKAGGKIDEKILTWSILSSADEYLKNQITYWLEGPREYEAWLTHLIVTPIIWKEILTESGKLERSYFSKTGLNFIRRVEEDAASIRAKKITSRHIFYTIIGNEANCLSSALTIYGIDIKKDLQVILTRELTQPGKKRLNDFQLTSDTILPTIVTLLKKAQKIAAENRMGKVSENVITRALIELYPDEITRLLPPSKVPDMTGLKRYVVDSLLDDEDENEVPKFSLKEIEKQVKGRIIGQDQAIESIMPWIELLRAGMSDDNRPAGVFLFTGPTGTGKTQLAKELARFVFGDEEMMIFLEMGQFQAKESMNNFVGASPGYVGYGEGQLTNGLRDKPESVVLFDEIEKANTQVFDALLRFADEGIITDPAGPIRDGRKCIIIMTSNAGQEWLRKHLKESPEAVQNPEKLSADLFDAAMTEFKERGFRPEFLGRVDKRITFMPFSLTSLRKIVDIVLTKELNKMKEKLSVEISIPDNTRDYLAQIALKKSMDEGARAVPRAIKTLISTPAIHKITDYKEENNGLSPENLEAILFGIQGKQFIQIEIVNK